MTLKQRITMAREYSKRKTAYRRKVRYWKWVSGHRPWYRRLLNS